ncbi:uncharacterized protein LOC127749986 [Frankliniella occidentalis]|uniref:Uncharacterized protein LOC127749986 n=1 Tax=Frankliniella occidentalis TaxID=133901 RepID=A0A9C6WZL9_FRAOC|nr:uncharacterized protein LOC127749986 [Frankliniella occidentalis]
MFKCWWNRRRRHSSGRYVRFTRVEPEGSLRTVSRPVRPSTLALNSASLATVACGARSAVAVVAPGLEVARSTATYAAPATPAIVVEDADAETDDLECEVALGHCEDVAPVDRPPTPAVVSEDDDDEVEIRRHNDRPRMTARATCRYPRRRRGRCRPSPTSSRVIPSIRISPRVGTLPGGALDLGTASKRSSPLPGTAERGILTRVRKKSYPFEDGNDEVFFIRENEDAEPEAIKVQLFDVEVVTVTAIPQDGGEEGGGNTLYLVDGYPSSTEGATDQDDGGFENSGFVDDPNDSDGGTHHVTAQRHVQFSEWMDHEKDIPDIEIGRFP